MFTAVYRSIYKVHYEQWRRKISENQYCLLRLFFFPIYKNIQSYFLPGKKIQGIKFLSLIFFAYQFVLFIYFFLFFM